VWTLALEENGLVFKAVLVLLLNRLREESTAFNCEYAENATLKRNKAHNEQNIVTLEQDTVFHCVSKQHSPHIRS
jgi:hypothetical protein